MPATKRTTNVKRSEPAKKKPAPAKPPVVKREVAPVQAAPSRPAAKQPPAVTAEILRRAISWVYLLSYCPPIRSDDFLTIARSMRGDRTTSGLDEEAFFATVVPEIARRIMAFHQETREPEKGAVAALADAIRHAEGDPDALAAFQTRMEQVAALPGRAKPENRLHPDKGCRLCAAPCRYGFFTLVSEPQMNRLQEMMAAEAKKPAPEQSPLGLVHRFTLSHISPLMGRSEGFIDIGHLANLSYCLLILGMAKSRLAMPEEQLRLFQAANQEFIRRSRAK